MNSDGSSSSNSGTDKVSSSSKFNKKAKHWMLTLFNDLDKYDAILKEQENSLFTAVAFQYERGKETNKLHIQGFVSFKNRRTLNQLTNLFGRNNHFEIARGSPSEARDYCTKEETRVRVGAVWGEFNGQGKRSDLESAFRTIQTAQSFREVIDKHPECAIKYLNNMERVFALYHSKPFEPTVGFVYSEWMLELEKILASEPDDRKII